MIEVKNISVSYSTKDVLSDLSISFAPGLVHGVLGINGAGKSTFFNTLYGIMKYEYGDITLEGNPISKDDVAYLQTENYFYPYMKGGEYLDLVSPEKDHQHWNDIFELPLNEFAQDYSTGMKKKLAFMGLILRDRKVYILDEPFNGVDIKSNEVLIKIIELLSKKGKYVLISSHILSGLIQMSDQIHHLKDGMFEPPIMKDDFSAFETSFRQGINDELSIKLKNLKF